MSDSNFPHLDCSLSVLDEVKVPLFLNSTVLVQSLEKVLNSHSGVITNKKIFNKERPTAIVTNAVTNATPMKSLRVMGWLDNYNCLLFGQF
jgi:hypothetical protein